MLVNNAGCLQFRGVEELIDETTRARIDTNVYGVVHVTRAVFPVMRAQRSGHIVGGSSMGGRTGSCATSSCSWLGAVRPRDALLD